MSTRRLTGVLGTAILSALLILPSTAHSTLLETTIDLSYTYGQDHLGDVVIGHTTVEQKYEVRYESALTSIFDLIMRVRLDVSDTYEDDAAETSKLAPSIEIVIDGPRASMNLTYDASRSRTEPYRGTSGDESFDNTYSAEFEIDPDYLPAARLKFERSRNYEEMDTEKVTRNIQFEVREEIGDFYLDFNYEHKDTEVLLPGQATDTAVAWAAAAAYKSTVWWDVDIDLTYEISERYSENFKRDVFIDEDKEYTQNITLSLNKSLDLTSRIKADLKYDYDFEQDLLLREFDYQVTQEMGLALDWLLLHWLEVAAEFTRETQHEYDVPPREKVESLSDKVELAFEARPRKWLQIAGKSKWEFEREIEAETGATVEKNDNALYELSMRHNWGKWWELTVTGSSEYEYANDWFVGRQDKVKASLLLVFFDIDIEPTYEVQRSVGYEAFEPLALEQKKKEEFSLRLDYAYDFSRFIQTAFTQGFSLTREDTVDEVLNFEEVVQLSEETKIKIALVDIIRDLTLAGEVTRKATDTEHDDEPMLVNIAYALALDWIVSDIALGMTFKYDDNGDSFDKASINTKVAWQYDNMDVSGEYQLNRTYAYEIDEQREFNLKMNVLF